MARLRTGDVAQIVSNGNNYIVLGKVETQDGRNQVVLTKNGNVKSDGDFRRFPRGAHPKILVANVSRIKRVHGRRDIDLDDVRTKLPELNRVLIRMDGTNGINCTAPNIFSLLAHAETLLG